MHIITHMLADLDRWQQRAACLLQHLQILARCLFHVGGTNLSWAHPHHCNLRWWESNKCSTLSLSIPVCPLSPLFYFHLPFSMMGFRTCFPKYGTLAYWIFTAGRIREMTYAGRTFWHSPQAGHKTLVRKVSSLNPKERNIISRMPRGIWMNSPCCFPQFMTLTSYSFCPVTLHPPSPFSLNLA